MEPPEDPMDIAIVIHRGKDAASFHPDPQVEELSPMWGSRFTADGNFEYLTMGDVYQQWVDSGRPSTEDIIAQMQAMFVEMYRNAGPLERAELEQRVRDLPGKSRDDADAEIARLRAAV